MAEVDVSGLSEELLQGLLSSKDALESGETTLQDLGLSADKQPDGS